MKLQLSALLLFLLLVHKPYSVSAAKFPFFETVIEKIDELLNKRMGGNVFEVLMKRYPQSPPKPNIPPQAKAPPPPAKPLPSGSHLAPPPARGFHLVKEYLYNFSYLQSSGPFDDSFDQETISAIQNYQRFFKLPITGFLNNETFNQILLPRCAVPDINFNYSFSADGISWPKAGNTWFPKGKKNLTYGFISGSKFPASVTKVFRDAFTRWAQATTVLNFTETTNDNADIKVGFYNLDDKIAGEVYGDSIIIRSKPSSNVTTGVMRLGGNNGWALPSGNKNISWEKDILDLESVVMHQIGHLLGLDHSSENDSVMYPSILPSNQRKVQLSENDKENILQRYTSGYSGSHGSCWGLLSTALSLACIIFLY